MTTVGTPKLSAGDVVGAGRFAITGVLGQGSQATTFEAVDKKDGTLVALKQFSIPRAESWKDVELAEREARVLSGLSHPLVPRYVAHFEEGGSLFLAMEKVEGETLLTLRARGALAQSDVVRFLHDASQTLLHLHSQAPPIIHRDIKPSNVILRPDGHFVLVDFGSVRHQLRPEGGSTVVGTFGYMAPEQFQGRAMPASDCYAVGATALSLLTGRDPEELPHKGLGIDVPAALDGAVPEPLERLLVELLEPDPDRRSRAPLGQLLKKHRLDKAPERRPDPRGQSHAEGQQQRQGERNEARRHSRRHVSGPPRHSSKTPELRGLARPPFLFFVLMGLWAARIVSSAVLFLLVPLVLTLLSVAFGPGLRRAALATRRAGFRTQRALALVASRAREAAATIAASEQRSVNSSPPMPGEEHGWATVDRVEQDLDEIEARMEQAARDLEQRVTRR